jgi:hypothetical protein
MLTRDCLAHPWLQKRSLVAPTPQPQPDDKIINTKNLRRFVIRRRWQVSNYNNNNNKIITSAAATTATNIKFILFTFFLLLESCKCFACSKAYGNEFVMMMLILLFEIEMIMRVCAFEIKYT